MSKKILCILLVGVLCCISFIVGVIHCMLGDLDDPYASNERRARSALQTTNLPDGCPISFVISGDHVSRDTYMRTEFVIAYRDDRQKLLELMANTPGWTVTPLTAQDYRDFVNVTWYPELEKALIADDIVFDAWFYCTTSPSTDHEQQLTGYFSFMGRVDRGFDFAVFDKETGIFIYIHQFG